MRSEDVRAHKERRELVAALERDALQQMTFEQKLQDAGLLFDTARRLDWETHTPAEIESVRSRWLHLVEHHRGRGSKPVRP